MREEVPVPTAARTAAPDGRRDTHPWCRPVLAIGKGQTFTLGQAFTEWNVRLTSTRIGALHNGADGTLRVYVDRTPVDGNPALIRLEPHQEIAIVFGRATQQPDVPDSYTFQPGE